MENKSNLLIEQIGEIVKDLNLPKQLLDKSSQLLSTLFGPATKELGELVGDRIKMWRVGNQVKMLSKTFDIIKIRGYEAKVLPAKILFPLLEFSSLEDDNYIQEKWANLLANAANPNNKFNSYNIYIEILKNLSKDELELLEKMYFLFSEREKSHEYSNVFKNYGHDTIAHFNLKELHSHATISERTFQILIGNLIRLNLIEYLFIVDSGFAGGLFKKSYSLAHRRETSSIRFTTLGFSFVENCISDISEATQPNL